MKQSDHPAKFVLFALVGVALIAAGWFLLKDGEAAPLEWGDPGASGYVEDEFVQAEALRADSVDSGLSERTELAEAVSLPEGDVLLTVSGRVMSTKGGPVANAIVSVLQRASFDFGQIFRGGGLELGGEELRQRFQRQPLTKSVRTKQDGTFVLHGRSFDTVEISVAAVHSQLAPTVVNRTWAAAEGALMVGDIVLDEGLTVRGVVLDDGGRPVPGAEVRYSEDGGGFGGGRGGFGGRGRGGRDSVLADLVAPVKTDVNGGFAMGPLPRTDFRLAADAARHVENRTGRIEPTDLGGVPDQTITLTRAAKLAGVVRDAGGNPVAGAEVVATRTRADRSEGGRDNGGGDNGGADNGGPGGRGGRRGGRGGGGGNSENTTKTDAKGEFELTELEPGVLRLEVDHDDYLGAELDPVDPRTTPWIEIGLETALSAYGVVVDAHTGQPVDQYGIEARRARGIDDGGRGGFGRGGRGGRGGGNDETAQAERQAREAFVKQRVGGSGETPGRTPKPTRHADGAFEIGKLDPGDYVFDIDAPGYVKVAAGTVTLATGKTGPLTFRVERGVSLTGRVTDRDGDPVAAADVQLHVPEPPQTGGGGNGANRGGRAGGGNRGGGGGRGGFGGGGFRRPLARASTDVQGRFELPPLLSGAFTLRVTAQGMMDYEDGNFVLQPQQNMVVKMVAGGVVHGAVLGYQPGDGGRVTLTHTDGERHNGTVDSRTGEYAIEGLPPGGYFASVSVGNNENGRRRMMAQMLSQPERQPDVFVGEGATVRFDLRSDDADLGVVKGEVWKNGAPAEGVQVRLARAEQAGAQSEVEGFRRGMERRLLSARVRADGGFEIASVPPGAYMLEVTAGGGGGGGRGGGRGGRGGGGGGALHSQPVQVQAGGTAVVRAQISTSEVEFVIEAPAEQGGGRLRIAMVSAVDAGDKPPDEWRGLESVQNFTVRDGTTGKQEIAPGTYRYAVTGRGVETLQGLVQVVAGSPTSLRLSVKAGESGQTRQESQTPPPGARQGGNGRR